MEAKSFKFSLGWFRPCADKHPHGQTCTWVPAGPHLASLLQKDSPASTLTHHSHQCSIYVHMLDDQLWIISEDRNKNRNASKRKRKGEVDVCVDRMWSWIIEDVLLWGLSLLLQNTTPNRHAFVADLCLFSAHLAYKAKKGKPESQFSVLKVETVQMNHKSNAGTFRHLSHNGYMGQQ